MIKIVLTRKFLTDLLNGKTLEFNPLDDHDPSSIQIALSEMGDMDYKHIGEALHRAYCALEEKKEIRRDEYHEDNVE